MRQQLRQAIRKLSRAPLFTVTILGTLALGIGANTAIFSVVNGVLLEPLPYDAPERLVGVWHTAPGLGFDQVNQSPATYLTYREEGRAFEDIALWDNRQASITGLDQPEEVRALLVTDGLFPLLRVKPELGRTFTPEDDSPESAETVMLAHGFWKRRFAADPQVLGRSLMVDGRPREVIGVMPRGFRLLRFAPEVYLPARFDRSEVFVGSFDYQGIARLLPGATLEQARADLARLVPVATERFPGGLTLGMLEEARFGPRVHALKEDVVGDVGEVLWVLLGTVGLVLLIACANVANLFLVRAEGRQRDMAVRSAMGASRRQVAGQFLVESVLLGLVAGAIGLFLAGGGLRLLLYLRPEGLPRLEEIVIDTTVLLFTLGISLFAGLFFGLFPVLRYSGLDLVAALKEGGRGSGAGRERHRLRAALVMGQVALALVLLIGSGLMMRSFQALRSVHPGFERPQEVQTFRITVPRAQVEEDLEVVQLYEQVLRRLEALPGVVSAGASFSITMDGWDSNDAVAVEELPVPDDTLPPIRRFKWIGGDYFRTMGNPLLAGRPIDWQDIHSRTPVVVVTENFAREYWGDPVAALGKRIRSGAGVDDPWREIVGVVGNVHDDGLSQEPVAVIYWPLIVEHFWGEETFVQRTMAFAVRTEGSPSSLLPEIRRVVWSLNPDLPLANVKTLDEILQDSLARTSFTLLMLAIASVLALLLGTLGIYGVISYAVSQRTREIGVRMALGAQRRTVSLMVVGYGMWLAAGGVGLGLLAALGLTRLMSALLFGVAPADPITYAAVAGLLVSTALLASYLAALRAAGIDPIEALRSE